MTGGSIESSAATFSTEPTRAEGGRLESWQGAEFRQGLEETSACDVRAGDFFGVDFFEPQQQEAPLHFDPHWQAWACEAASNVSEGFRLEASTDHEHASTIRTAGQSRPPIGAFEGGRGSARTGDVGSLRGGFVREIDPDRSPMIEAGGGVVKGRVPAIRAIQRSKSEASTGTGSAAQRRCLSPSSTSALDGLSPLSPGNRGQAPPLRCGASPHFPDRSDR